MPTGLPVWAATAALVVGVCAAMRAAGPDRAVTTKEACWDRASGDRERPAIAVLVYNYAAVPREVLNGARDTVSRVVGYAGVRTRWIDPSVRTALASVHPEMRPDMFTVQMILHAQLPARAMGFVRTGARESGRMAFVSFGKVTQVARDREQKLADLLGYVMVHEMGHLLLPSLDHTRHGLMRSDWEDDEFRRMAAGYLRFSRSEEALIRASVLHGCARAVPGS